MEPSALGIDRLGDFGAALLIGALVGLERERRKADEDATATGGIRTFILVALAGALAAWASQVLGSPWVFAAGLVSISGVTIAGYVAEKRVNPAALGLTTEVAAIAVFLLAGLAVAGERDLALCLAIVAAATMAFKGELHGLVAKVGHGDLHAVLRLLIATFVILPLLPDRAIDPLGAVNPHAAWLLVILISSLSLVGYVASRWLGHERGFVVTGLAGGLVSSTAVTLSCARQSREKGGAALSNALAAGVLASWTVMFVRVLVAVAVVHPPLLRTLWMQLTVLALVTIALTAWFYRAGRARSGAGAGGEAVALQNPFSLLSAAKFAAFFVLVLVVVKFVQQHHPGGAVLGVAALAGLTNVDAITLSMAGATRDGGEAALATLAIIIALLSNTLVKCALGAALGGAALRNRIVVATALVLAAAALVTWLT